MTLKVLTFDLLSRPVFGPEEAKEFFDEKRPPPLFQTWIAKSLQTDFTGEVHPFVQWNIAMYPPPDADPTGAKPAKPHARSLTLLINELVIQSVLVRKSFRSQQSLLNERHMPLQAPQIWPNLGPVEWPPPVLITKRGLHTFATGQADVGFLTTKNPPPPPPRRNKPPN
jgi:hypothetical protein